jgi:hypothetical protein
MAARVIVDSRSVHKPRTIEGRVETLEEITAQHTKGLALQGKQIGDLTIAQQRIDSALLALGARMSEFGVIHGRQLDAIHAELREIGACQARCAQACQDRYEAEGRARREERDRRAEEAARL